MSDPQVQEMMARAEAGILAARNVVTWAGQMLSTGEMDEPSRVRVRYCLAAASEAAMHLEDLRHNLTALRDGEADPPTDAIDESETCREQALNQETAP